LENLKKNEEAEDYLEKLTFAGSKNTTEEKQYSFSERRLAESHPGISTCVAPNSCNKRDSS